MAAETSFVNQVHGLSRGYCEVKKDKVGREGMRGVKRGGGGEKGWFEWVCV